jgi:hypothetical protein
VSHASVDFQREFVEEAVFLKIKMLEDTGQDPVLVKDFHRQREAIYENGGDDCAFAVFYGDFFKKLGWKAGFEGLLAEFPLLDAPGMTVFFRRVFNRRDEGSELYVEGNKKTALFGLQISRLKDHDLLSVFLRHEFLRVSDMLDPLFEYSSCPVLGGQTPAEDDAIRERFAKLWDASISARVGYEGFQIPASESGDARLTFFQKIKNQVQFTQKELLEMAKN